ncbi:hypothetical protein T552_01994 [Pneumocystis carinii B80]|uniref:PH domain-containing protein n=1 Tax=Pneumocystis carinii (strain B80) TaxID=1408658 RepID=A0A0W4ZID7_PNEC8|nr:hypothetical protein T552_01994 [Pneumocystis carinii B80]KTW28135.1 hypothetical protein T552_01994 [Pneumocystis carinii B80]
MTELETIEVQARDLLLRWIYVPDNETLSWQLKPHKKSIRYGICKRTKELKVTMREETELRLLAATSFTSHCRLSKNHKCCRNGSLKERLEKAGLTEVVSFMRCKANVLEKGVYHVGPNNGGHFALVFDNTFSKQTSKIITYVLNACLMPLEVMSFKNTSLQTIMEVDPSKVYSGVLLKKKRNRLQGWARRYFTLNIATAVLSYTGSSSQSILRGIIPLSIAAVSVNPKLRYINIDSGAEIWHLRVLSDKDWVGWCRAIEKAAKNCNSKHIEQQSVIDADAILTSGQYESLNRQLWSKVENLVNKIGVLKVEMDKMLQQRNDNTMEIFDTKNQHDSSDMNDINQNSTSVVSLKRKNFILPSSIDELSFDMKLSSFQIKLISSELGNISSQFKSLLSEHHVLSQHSSYISALKTPEISINSISSRTSMDTTFTRDYWFDAEEMPENVKPYLLINNDFENAIANELTTDENDSKMSNMSQDSYIRRLSHSKNMEQNKCKQSLYPLTYSIQVNRRENIPPITVSPPSLFSFLRKNVGKDLSSITMPVIANEPLNLLQRAAEDLEYSELIDKAINKPKKDGERILYIAAFAISSFSNMRCKERLVRKPFSPLLGETFELVREDKGFRFLAEKVSHRPVIIACHAESSSWTFSHSPKPKQRFWGKSAELITDGSVLIKLVTGDVYIYRKPAVFLRNVAFGEKYVEPSGHMTILNISTGEKAVISFKPGKLFSGRCEELFVQAYSSSGALQPLSITGFWTHSLVLKRSGTDFKEVIWNVGSLVEDPLSHCGFTKFAASLNEITCIEEGLIPNTDTRLRKDQRNRENGNIDEAEKIKSHLEEKQRQRRKKMESENIEWKPRWFYHAKNQDPGWIIKTGTDSYWIQREKQMWTKIPELW